MNSSSRLRYWALALLVCCTSPMAGAGKLVPVEKRPALESGIAAGSVMIGEAFAGNRIVAVGERGIILLSDDAGKNWRQAKTPTSVTLTAVYFPDSRNGWVVGHAGVILHSADAGETWSMQLDGVSAAKLILAQAEQAGGQDAQAQAMLRDAQRLVDDGPDKPFLDVYFIDSQNGYAVGAFGIALRTADGGETWTPFVAMLGNKEGSHLYAIKGDGRFIAIAGERGFIAISNDGGESFSHPDLPYKGSLFSVVILPSKTIVAAGLRGNMFYGQSPGYLFRKSEGGAGVSYNSLQLFKDGVLAAANQAGQIWISRDGGKSLSKMDGYTVGLPLNAMLQAGDGSIIGTSFRGMVRLENKFGVNTGSEK